MSKMCTKVTQIFRFVCLLRVEVLMFVLTFSFYFKRTPLEVLIQDKLCRNHYNLSQEFCFRLPYMTENETDYHLKDQILAHAVKYKWYQSIINNIPTVVWPLFVGEWIDRHKKARKAILAIGAVTHGLEAVINFANCYFFESGRHWSFEKSKFVYFIKDAEWSNWA